MEECVWLKREAVHVKVPDERGHYRRVLYGNLERCEHLTASGSKSKSLLVFSRMSQSE